MTCMILMINDFVKTSNKKHCHCSEICQFNRYVSVFYFHQADVLEGPGLNDVLWAWTKRNLCLFAMLNISLFLKMVIRCPKVYEPCTLTLTPWIHWLPLQPRVKVKWPWWVDIWSPEFESGHKKPQSSYTFAQKKHNIPQYVSFETECRSTGSTNGVTLS